jgi:two-component system chemotaxis sensor kinase CheA
MPEEPSRFEAALEALAAAAERWQPGDLASSAELRRLLKEALADPGAAALPERERAEASALSAAGAELLDDEGGPAWIDRLRSWLASPALARSPCQAPAPRGLSSEYGPDYFNGIVDDRKMLEQLCEEVREHLETAQYTLVDLEYDASDPENVNRVFRAFHTIKSSGAFLGLRNIEETAHAMEDLLVMVRDGKISVSKELTDLVFRGIGILKDLLLIIEASDYSPRLMEDSFRRVDIGSYIGLIRRAIQERSTRRIGEILVDEGKLDKRVVREILAKQATCDKKFGEIALEERLVSEEDFRKALSKQSAASHKASYVRVSNERLNSLIDIVGELVVTQSMLRQSLLDPSATGGAERTISQLESITTGIKNLVLSMGMVPISEIFNKLRVVARNTAAETGKAALAEFSGEDTELDRNVIEAVYDPLVHIVRNAVDHGIEDPREREAAGKPGAGRIRVSAEHKGNGIEITVSDDGRGIDRAAVLAKAARMGLVDEATAAGLEEWEIYTFLFQPGFSTAKRVSEVSGRGVGLDVVRQNIEQIHGKVEVTSEPGKGSTFTIRIPLTLAIIDGFVTVVEGTKYVFPFSLVEEIVVPMREAISALDDGRPMLLNRGAYIPVVLAAQAFARGLGGAESCRQVKPDDLAGRCVIVLGYEGRRYGVAVDSILGKQEIVIKSLNEALRGMRVFSGGTIFGDGSIGFVVDIEEFVLSIREA